MTSNHFLSLAFLLMFQPQNLVLTGEFPDCDVKLCDFGISRYISHGADIREILGTPDYVGEYLRNLHVKNWSEFIIKNKIRNIHAVHSILYISISFYLKPSWIWRINQKLSKWWSIFYLNNSTFFILYIFHKRNFISFYSNNGLRICRLSSQNATTMELFRTSNKYPRVRTRIAIVFDTCVFP